VNDIQVRYVIRSAAFFLTAIAAALLLVMVFPNFTIVSSIVGACLLLNLYHFDSVYSYFDGETSLLDHRLYKGNSHSRSDDGTALYGAVASAATYGLVILLTLGPWMTTISESLTNWLRAPGLVNLATWMTGSALIVLLWLVAAILVGLARWFRPFHGVV
jgi:hypothetical protein